MPNQDCAMVLEEQPAKVAEAVKLFLQGLGYIMRPRKAASTQVRTIEVQSSPWHSIAEHFAGNACQEIG